MLRKLKFLIFFMLIIQDVFCMRIIGESLEYKSSRFSNVQDVNKELFESEPTFFQKFTDEILRWQYIDFDMVAYECLHNTIIANAKIQLSQKLSKGGHQDTLFEDDYAIALAGEILHFDETFNPRDDFDWRSSKVVERACFDVIQKEIRKINQHMSFVRLIALDINEGKPFFRACCLPCIFLSGTYATNGISLLNNFLSTMVRFIDTYNFYSTSDQAYSHSERAICLALSEQYGDFKLSNFIQSNTKDVCIQIRNLSRMCVNCEHFIYGRDIYFINIAGKGCFVTNQYNNNYQRASSDEEKRTFIRNYSDSLRLSAEEISNISSFNSTELNAMFDQIKPKNILELIPYSNKLIIETMTDERLSEVVKIYLP